MSIDWEAIFSTIERETAKVPPPSVTEVAQQFNSPYHILISTVISLRTKDEVTLKASLKLFEEADSPEKMIKLSSEEISSLIYPAGFYKTKGEQILKISHILIEKYGGKTPSEREALLALPGVGLKTSSLVMSEGFELDAICVDTHVHRICNRLGWITTKTPDDSMAALEKRVPKPYWRKINHLFVLWGQGICTPLSPRCSQCSIKPHCQQVGVTKSR